MGRARPSTLYSESSGSEYEFSQQEPPVGRTFSRKSLTWRSIKRPHDVDISDNDSVNDGSVEDIDETKDVDETEGQWMDEDSNTPVQMKPPSFGITATHGSWSRKVAPGMISIVIPDDEDDFVQGKPRGRLWMKEVRIPQIRHFASAIRDPKPFVQRSKKLQQTTLTHHFTKTSRQTHNSLFANFNSSSTMTAARKKKQKLSHDGLIASEGNKVSTTTPAGTTILQDSATEGFTSSGRPTPSTEPTSRLTSPEPNHGNLRPTRQAARVAKARNALNIDGSHSEGGNDSDFNPLPINSDPESEDADEGLKSDESTVEEDSEGLALDEELSEDVETLSSHQPAGKVFGAVHRPVINNPNEKPRKPVDEYGCCLDDNLPPISDIREIFTHMTEKSLSVKGAVLSQAMVKGRTKAQLQSIFVKHDLQDVLSHLKGRKLRVATMCSGTESPILALGLISEALKPHGHLLQVDHLFSAEIVPFKQAYIERNFAPPIIFRDITEISAAGVTKATTAYGAKMDIPDEVDLLVTGFSCVDHSNLNVNKQVQGKAGNPKKTGPSESGDTMHAMLSYIKKFRPKIAIVENVTGAPWDRLRKLLDERGYASRHVILDTKNYYIPHTRQRGYMFCVDQELYANSSDANKATDLWLSLMQKFQRVASSPAQDFLLGDNDPRLVLGRLELESGRGEGGARKIVDWTKCEARHVLTRQNLGLGSQRPIMNWQSNGYSKGPDYFWHTWGRAQVKRVWDTIDINYLRSTIRGFDNQYKARIIDMSQNVDRNTDATRPGVAACLTPSGIPFSTLRGGPIIGLESLSLQGLPIDKLQLTQESQAKLQDLAGNAMTSTVVGVAMLSALISAFQILPAGDGDYLPHEEKEEDHGMTYSETNTRPLDDLPSEYNALSVLDACEAAARSARLCFCEDVFGKTRAPIQQCLDCKHTTCISCGKHPKHNYAPYDSSSRISPIRFERMISAALPLRISLSGVSGADMEKMRTGFKNLGTFTTAQRDSTMNAINLAFESELRYCAQPDRSEVWTFQYEADHARLELVISAAQAEWKLFAKVPANEAISSPVRKFLSIPIARMIPNELDLNKGEWMLRVPGSYNFTAVIEGLEGSMQSSHENRLGLQNYNGTKTYGKYLVTVEDDIHSQLGVKIGGTYTSLPKCGTASGALHVQNESANSAKPLFFFLDPDRLGNPKDDSFVISYDKRRLVKGQRTVIARIDHTWRPTRVKELIHPDGFKELKSHEVWHKGRGKDARTYHEMLFDYKNAPDSVRFQVDGIWTGLPKAILLASSSDSQFRRVESGFNILWAPRSCSTAHVVLVCEAHVPSGELQSWIGRNLIDKIQEMSFFKAFAWLTERAGRFSHLSDWRIVPHLQLGCCTSCSPTPPRILWKLNKDEKLVPFEDHEGASHFERALKTRPLPIITRVEVDNNGSVSLNLSINPATLMHRAVTNLSSLTDGTVETSWRLLTDNKDSTAAHLPSFSFETTHSHAEIAQPPNFRTYHLTPTQLGSLRWMIDQELDPKPFVEEEVVEAVVNQLGWRLEGRATKKVIVRGGVLAHEVGFGKTPAILAVIDIQRQKDATMATTEVRGRVSIKATLIMVPKHLTKQWLYEVKKFLCGQYKYKVLVIETLTCLKKLRILDFQRADIIIVSWNLCENEGYLFKAAQFAGRNELPILHSHRVRKVWYDKVLLDIAKTVDNLKGGGEDLYKKVCARLKKDQMQAADATNQTYIPSKRLRGAQYRAAKLAASNEKKRKRGDDATEDDQTDKKVSKRESSKKNLKYVAKERPDDFLMQLIEQGRLDWKEMPSPLLELFEFSRVVVDEYTYVAGCEGMVISNLRGRSRWILSGTPPREDFADVKSISQFLGINLGIDDLTPGVTKRLNTKNLTKDMTSFEEFQVFNVSHSASWHENRHKVAQRFLTHYVRQNPVDRTNLPSSRHWMPVVLPDFERALYLEIQSNLTANSGEMFTDLPTEQTEKVNDRAYRINEAFRQGSGPEALVKTASYFTLGEPPSSRNACKNIETIRQNEYDAVCELFARQARIVEYINRKSGKNCSQFDEMKRKFREMEFGDEESSQRMVSLLQTAALPLTRNQVGLDKERTDVDSLREKVNCLEKRANELVKCGRSLRFFKSIRNLQDTQIDVYCAVCKRSSTRQNISILVECGHVVCTTCLHDFLDLDSAMEKCRVPHCEADMTDFQTIPAEEFVRGTQGNQYCGKKFEEIICLVKNIPASEQVLLFVQYAELIEKICKAFDDNGVSYANLSCGGDPAIVLEKFKNDSSVEKKKVLIINIGDASASGSNLINANHVIFLSPYQTESTQAYKNTMIQAEARAHRYGQKKHVHIYNFLSLKTIDVDTVEWHEKISLVNGIPADNASIVPHKGFRDSGYQLSNGTDGAGAFRSETSVCVMEF